MAGDPELFGTSLARIDLFRKIIGKGRPSPPYCCDNYEILYNTDMLDRRWRQILGVVILLISLAILIWGFWPYADQTRIMPIRPGDMQLPTPESYLWLLTRLI